MNNIFEIHILPRKEMPWGEFVNHAPRSSIALDGVVLGGPRYNPTTQHINFDHHDGVVREATMSTAMQVHMAIKGGLIPSFRGNGDSKIHVFINDTDQDASFAVWLLLNYKQFEGVQGNPHINRLLALTDRWDVTGGAYPMNLNESLVREHNWVFRPYTDLRKSGALANANEAVLRSNLEAILHRITKAMMGEAEQIPLDTRHTILYDSPEFKVVDEIGGNEARYHLFNHGMNAYLSLVAQRADGSQVMTIGRRSRFIPFPVTELYADFNEAEGLTKEKGWNGSDIVGGSPRATGTKLSWEQLRDIIRKRLAMQ
jgi:hypothetical protein